MDSPGLSEGEQGRTYPRQPVRRIPFDDLLVRLVPLLMEALFVNSVGESMEYKYGQSLMDVYVNYFEVTSYLRRELQL